MKKIVCISLFLLAVVQLGAQNMVSGRVTDLNNGLELIGCSVAEIDANNRVIGGGVTDNNGDFSFRLKNAKDRLSVSYIGYITQIIAIGNNRHFQVKLNGNNRQLGDVVVHAKKKKSDGSFNIAQREESMALSTFKMDAIEGISVSSAEDALQGRVAGLDIIGSGVPGSGSQMRIRGTTTITGNAQPLVVVNGVPFSGNIDATFDFSNATDQEYADLLNVNTDDIEEITVLKDAASTAMWGSKGANGVLLIKTKKGSRGKTSLSYSYKLSGATQPKGMDMLSGSDYTMLMKQEFFNQTLASSQSYSDYSFDELNYNYTNFAQAYNYDHNTDWVAAVTKQGWINDHYLTVSGGGERANFRLSAGYYDQTGTNLKQAYQRYTTRAQLDYNVSSRMLFSSEFQYTYSNNDRNYSSLLDIAYKKMPNMAIYEEDALGNLTGKYFNITPGEGIGNTSGRFDSNQRNLMNPVALGNLAKNNLKGYRILPKIALQFDFFDPDEIYLRYNGWVTIDMNHELTQRYLPAACVFNSNTNYGSANQASNQVSDKMTVSTENSLTWQSRFPDPNKHDLQVQIKMQTATSTSNAQYLETGGLPSSEMTDAIATGHLNSTTNGNSSDRSIGWMGRLHYTLLGRYIFDANYRVDGSTQFGSANRYGLFPGVAAKWIISDEPLFKSSVGNLVGERVVTLLAIRPSWGIAGRQPGMNYLQYSLLSTASQGYMDMSAVYPTRIRLDGLKWERVTSLNLGSDLELWDGKVAVNFDWYKKRTNDLLFSDIDIPSTSGFATLTYKNVGSMDNNGWELNVSLNKVVESNKFSMDVNCNFASNKNTIRSLDESVLNNFNNHENFGNGDYYTRLQVGHSFGSIYGFRYKGVYSYSFENLDEATAEGKTCPAARDANGHIMYNYDGTAKPMYYYYSGAKYQFKGGDAIYEDINHDGSIDQYDVVYLGDCNPKMTGGFGLTFRYDKYAVNFFCNYRYGGKIVNMARMNAENMYYAYNQCTTVNWRWRKEGDVTDVPRAVYQQGYNWLASDRYVEDGSFLRMKYIMFRYAVPNNLVKHIGLDRLSAYLTINNIFCLDHYSGADPEINICTDTSKDFYGICMDNSTTPRPHEWTLGFSATF
ncbi:MAG: SusC/RagA family TonB-linked outer membrane protein [Bacteroidota bacterium]|nr:SusC/RagA family TonB-linked outer membrane protein [Bacteroidota bacterium]